MKKIITALTIYLVLSQILLVHAQQENAIVLTEGNRTYNNQENAFRIFTGEILPRTSIGFCYFPDSTKVKLGFENDMSSIAKYKTFTPELIFQMVKKQSVFLKDGKLHEGYLFNLSFLKDSIIKDGKIKIANYTSALLTLKKDGENSISEYPYNTSGLAIFYKEKDKFKDRFIRIIVPGYVTVFIDTEGIEKIPSVFDSKIYTEYQILIEKQKQTVLFNAVDSICYKVDKGIFENTLKMSNGICPIIYPTKKADKQFNIKNGKATIELIPKWYEQYLKWIIIGVILIIITITLLINRQKIMTLISKMQKTKTIKVHENQTGDTIAKENNVDWKELKKFNKFSDEIKKNDILSEKGIEKIKIPINKEKQENEDDKETKTIDVQEDDTCISVAKTHGITCNELKRLNQQNKNFKNIQETKRLIKNYNIKTIIVPKQNVPDKLDYTTSALQDISNEVDIDQKRIADNTGALIKSVDEIKQNQSLTEQKLDEVLNKLSIGDSEELKQLKEDKDKLDKEIIKLNTKTEGLNETIEQLEQAIDEHKKEVLQSQEQIQRFKQQGIFIDNFAVLTNKFWSLFDNIISIENKILSQIKEQNQAEVRKHISLVYSKYIQSVAPGKFTYWLNILQMIKDNDGLITDRNLINKLESKTSAEEKVEIISWLIVNELLPTHLGALLVLLEEIRNTEKITGAKMSTIIEDIGNNTKEDLINTMKQGFGIEAENINLFNDIGTYNNIRTVNTQPMYNINLVESKLKMGDILEIKTYGMKLKEKTIETIVIAK